MGGKTIPAARVHMGSTHILKAVLPALYDSLGESERAKTFSSSALILDLCPDCEGSLVFWLRTGQEGLK